MNILKDLTPGTILLLTGAAVTTTALFLALWTAITAGKKKKEMERQMREKY
ncbi:hypothetical protein F220043C3_56620 [Enterocloster asparagiformis]|uniref:hypothetical protein n=1 Tax=Enterocloster asparagiformis TaxID=333367 RepID=UPI0034BB9B90